MEFPKVKVGDRWVGVGEPVFVVAEIGINHNGDLQVAKRLIDGAVQAGADAVKFQKRTPELCVPRDQWHVMRDTPWGRMSYIDYRHRIELSYREFAALDIYCKERGILWFASCWDEKAYEFMEAFEPPCYKAASASLTDLDLLRRMKSSGRPLFLSSGMSTLEQIREAVKAVGAQRLLLAHSESSYPCPVEQLNLRVIPTLQAVFPSIPIGYSGHETGLATTWAAVALGATHVERHITLDRAMWGSDQAASIELPGFVRLVQKIRDIEKALGDGVKRVSESELRALVKLRRVPGTSQEPELAAVNGAA